MVAALRGGPGRAHAPPMRTRASTRFGPNRLPEASGPSAARLLLDQVRTPLMWALLAAGGLALALGEIEDGLVVLAVVVLNALIGFAQEYRAGPRDRGAGRAGRRARARAPRRRVGRDPGRGGRARAT